MDTAQGDLERDLPTGPLELPKDSEIEGSAPPPAVPVDAIHHSQIERVQERLDALKEQGAEWAKEHRALAVIILVGIIGLLLYFWPIITSALIAQHLLKNTQGTANKMQMYKIIAILFAISLSVQALWIVQLAQAASFSR